MIFNGQTEANRCVVSMIDKVVKLKSGLLCSLLCKHKKEDSKQSLRQRQAEIQHTDILMS